MALVFIILVPDCDKLSAKKHNTAKVALSTHFFIVCLRYLFYHKNRGFEEVENEKKDRDLYNRMGQ